MYDALSFAEIDGQHVELLPARTVLSMFSLTDSPDVTCQSVASQSPGFLLSTGGTFASFTCLPTVTKY
ncbi:MAG: hypothetical protein JO296_18785 [Pseudonocardiales bacterium]|jgi:hypothetical protein|nr:hypothetical protein [Pseudonocardiales bacterium]MBV9652166.1 hypothetical protein [Pseudonocardiales bacterium]HZS21263.1 hypothetical protein [Pseudonocardiaceae bacterium]